MRRNITWEKAVREFSRLSMVIGFGIGLFVGWGSLLLLIAMSGCSALDPKMALARSHYDETDRATGHIERCMEVREIRRVGDQIQVLAPHSTVWRDVPADRDWSLIVWDWEDYSE